MDELTTRWQQAKAAAAQAPPTDTNSLLVKAQQRKKNTLYFQYGNVLVLTLTLLGLVLFFYYVASFKQALSQLGIALLLGSVTVRIGLEVISIYKARKVLLVHTAVQTTRDTLALYQFRRKIHGPATFALVALYSLGFYALTPEFSHYFTLRRMILLDSSFVVGALFLIWQIRKGIQAELVSLAELVELENDLHSPA